MSRSNTKPPTKVGQPDPRPWVIGGVDYGLSVMSTVALAEWAFELAAASVSDWPAGLRSVRITERYVLERLHGRAPRATPSDDIWLTAGLLARIFEADLSLRMSETVAVLDEIGLPTEVVPLRPRTAVTTKGE